MYILNKTIKTLVYFADYNTAICKSKINLHFLKLMNLPSSNLKLNTVHELLQWRQNQSNANANLLNYWKYRKLVKTNGQTILNFNFPKQARTGRPAASNANPGEVLARNEVFSYQGSL